MDLPSTFLSPIEDLISGLSTTALIFLGLIAFVFLSIFLNVLRQALFRNSREPPVVFHYVPFIGSTIAYGIDPYKFFFKNMEKVSHGSLLKAR